LAVVIGAVFIFSAISKYLSIGFFEISLVEQNITDSRTVAAWTARILIAYELFLGLAVLMPYYRRNFILPAIIVTLTGFTIFLLLSYFGATQAENCGCFGNIVAMSAGQSILKNIFLLVLTVVLFKSLDNEPKTKNWRIPSLLAVVCMMTIFLTSPLKSDQNSAFGKFTDFEPGGHVDLLTGDKIVAVLDPNCEHCIETVFELGFLVQESEKYPDIYFLFGSDNKEDIETFFEITGTRFPYARISSEQMFALIGAQTPRLYWLQDGEVKAYWDEDIISQIEDAFYNYSKN
jgi:hypothetical protein